MGVSEGIGGSLVKYGILAGLVIGGGILLKKWWDENQPLAQGQKAIDDTNKSFDENPIVKAINDTPDPLQLITGWLQDAFNAGKSSVQTNVFEVTDGNAPAAWSGEIPPGTDIIQMAKNAGAYHSGIQPMDSVMGLQGIGLSTEILQEISPTLMLVEKQYNAPGVHTSEIVYQDVWGGIIGPNLAAGSDPQKVADCLASGGGWNWNTRECV